MAFLGDAQNGEAKWGFICETRNSVNWRLPRGAVGWVGVRVFFFVCGGVLEVSARAGQETGQEGGRSNDKVKKTNAPSPSFSLSLTSPSSLSKKTITTHVAELAVRRLGGRDGSGARDRRGGGSCGPPGERMV